MNQVILMLGSNLGDRVGNINTTIMLLDFIHDITISSYYESPALLPQKHDNSWDIPFINIALKGFTTLDPIELFTKIKKIETKLGRPIDDLKWSPRIIDIDIIFYNDSVIDTEQLKIPHPEMHKRAFVVVPICDISPNYIHPSLKTTVFDIKKSIDASSLESIQKI